MENIAAIDVGMINSAIAFWKDSKLVFFESFEAKSVLQLSKNLKKYEQYFQHVTHVFVEQQMRINFRAVKIEAQVYMWLTMAFPKIVAKSFAARKKYMFIDKVVYDTKYKRKKWAAKFAETIIPPDLLGTFLSLKKRDDVADAILIGHIMLTIKNKKIDL